MARKLETGDDASGEEAEMIALNAAIKAEMQGMLEPSKPS
jgi:hypothetical protein